MSDGNAVLPAGGTEASHSSSSRANPKQDRNLPDDTQVSFVPMSAVSDMEGAITDAQTRPYGEVRKGYIHSRMEM